MGTGARMGAVPAYAEADRLIRRGAELTSAGASDAQEPLEEAVSLAPDDPEILVRAAALSFDNGRYERSRELLLRARDHATPDFDLMPTMAYLGGALVLRDGRRDEALLLLEAAFEASPSSRGYGYLLAVELLRAGRTADARTVAAQALDSGAIDEDLPRLRDHLDATAAAEEAYAAHADPATALALADALNVFAEERAEPLFEFVLERGDGRERAMAAFQLGALVDERDPAAAQLYYEQALAGEDPFICGAAAYNLGGMLVTSDPVQARGMFERASESPDDALAGLAREQLAALG
jgi:thioredoxin-like negative regulator of GroEL